MGTRSGLSVASAGVTCQPMYLHVAVASETALNAFVVKNPDNHYIVHGPATLGVTTSSRGPPVNHQPVEGWTEGDSGGRDGGGRTERENSSAEAALAKGIASSLRTLVIASFRAPPNKFVLGKKKKIVVGNVQFRVNRGIWGQRMQDHLNKSLFVSANYIAPTVTCERTAPESGLRSRNKATVRQ